MGKNRVVVALAVGLAWLLMQPAVAGAEERWKCADGAKAEEEVVINEQHPGVLAFISPPPTSRVRLNLDKNDGSAHYEIEWDPALPGASLRKLKPDYGTYRLSVWVQPQLMQGLANQTTVLAPRPTATKARNSVYLNYNLNCFKRGSDGIITAEGRPFDALVDAPANAEVPLPPLKITIERQTRQDEGAALTGTLSLGAAQAEASLRGLADPVPDSVEQVLKLITAIAIERAESRGFGLLKIRITDRLCKKLTWEKLSVIVKGANGRLFPATCALIESMRLRDLASSGKATLAALRSDVQQAIFPVLARIALKKIAPEANVAKIAQLEQLVARLMRLTVSLEASSPTTARDTQALLAEVSRLAWDELEGRTGVNRTAWLALRTLIGSGDMNPVGILAMIPASEVSRSWRILSAGVVDDAALRTLRNLHPESQLLKKELGDVRSALLKAEPSNLEERIRIGHSIWRGLESDKQQAIRFDATSIVLTNPPKILENIVDLAKAHSSTTVAELVAALTTAEGVAREGAEVDGLFPAAGPKTESLASEVYASLMDKEGPIVACGVQLMIATVNECVSRGGCSASEVADMVGNSSRHFLPGHASSELSRICFAGKGEVIAKLRKKWPTLDVLAERAIFIALPPKNASSRDLVAAGVDVVFEIASQLCAKEDGCSDSKAQLTSLRSLVEAILDENSSLAMAHAARMITESLDGQERTKAEKKTVQAFELLSAFASYAAIKDGDDPEAAKEARAARKKAIDSMIDSATDRKSRHGDFVVSLGANPGLNAVGFQTLFGADAKRSYDRVRLQLPFGVALQWLPGEKKSWLPGWLEWLPHKSTGVHLMASPIELGQYLPSTAETKMEGEEGEAENEVDWYDLVSLRGQFGFMFGSPSNSLVVGLEVAWAPTLFERKVMDDGAVKKESGVLRYGVFAAYYVPFFDFN